MSERIPTCINCNDECYCLGYKVAIPKKDDDKAWIRLRDDCFARDIQHQERVAKERVRRFHDTERKIYELESMEENQGRKKLIKQLKQELTSR